MSYRPPYPSMEERLLANSVHDPETGCRVWIGRLGKSRAGPYPRLNIYVDGKVKTVYAHRVSWEIRNEREIPPGCEIDHTCSNTICIEPDHLELVDGDENKARYRARKYEQERAERFGDE